MTRPPFLPTLRQAGVLAALTLTALGHAMIVRYFAMENTPVALSCDADPQGWLCASRQLAIVLHNPPIFGIAALILAALNLMRPSVILCAAGLVAAAYGLVIYNTPMAAIAVALLCLSLARPAPEPE
jgi:hypothetical protein